MTRIAPILLDWYALKGRELPWRQSGDPYRIWLSEVILQQTRVAQGVGYYLRFVARFGDVEALAAASQSEVLKCWEGLGYYSRARNLHAAAGDVMARFGGKFPQSYVDVRSLAGVGDYTAAAICSAAYNSPYAVVDGNVYRVLARLFDLDVPIDTAAGKRLFASLAQEQLDPKRAGEYNQAIMDFGALQCTPAQPRCEECPLAACCLALEAGTIGVRPVKRPKNPPRERWLNFLRITCGDRTTLHRREKGDIWQGLYEFPLIETPRSVTLLELQALPTFNEWVGVGSWQNMGSDVLQKRRLSHQIIHTTIHHLQCRQLTPAAAAIAIPDELLGDYPLPQMLLNYLMGIR